MILPQNRKERLRSLPFIWEMRQAQWRHSSSQGENRSLYWTVRYRKKEGRRSGIREKEIRNRGLQRIFLGFSVG